MSHRYVIVRAYQCPECQGVFEVRHSTDDLSPPKTCQLCGADVTKKKRKPKQVANPNARYPKGLGVASKSGDQVYRALEQSSETRIQQASDLFGMEKSELSAMKMTDMKDNLREGDQSMQSTTVAAATQIKGEVSGNMTFQDRSAAAEYAKSTGVGPEPYAGNRAREMIVSSHAQRAAAVVSQGRKG